ncbi:hypothetical protein A1Q1_03323 [Trichosporon asahii var. asahii CBS 2479]|uniref:Uncharacterized protein n=1 Tax=Trichosporon asahii var. asahii (strain ATCC 90039 / CBS 2479 / JCM 2466 / KCTC 7840 / NBRC 103889/ NCYC 2677 / UAMH 7654) TaxID=1186058 RepID=J5QK01_TRIAS|nr:hypothetical protein A1Q1_03323 [Trichosporon asahii var. asahii CBS 2479]EJT47748.1 hypothetical protein A1Q1_03323 [Trichosporon asahii var. asahii CBS 2479]
MSVGLWQTPLPPSVARSRLISNIAAIVLSIFCRTLFSPYLALRSVVVSLLDKLGLPGSSIVWWIDPLVSPDTRLQRDLDDAAGSEPAERLGASAGEVALDAAGLFYDPDSTASPAKVALSLSQRGQSTPTQKPAQPQPTEKKDGFVLVDREEREWVDNVWKGVRGKAGRLGL